ncbi:hypothetical protein ACWPKO_16365 [Coraliomargarita sp. W4R53]
MTLKSTLLVSFILPIAAQAIGTLTQTYNFNEALYFSETNITEETEGTAPYSFATFDQFNTSLGTLDSVTVVWDLNYTIGFTVDDGVAGEAQMNFNSSLSIEGLIYNGTGGGGGNGTSGDEGKTAIERTSNVSHSFTFVDGNHNSAIDSYFEGTGTFDIEFGSTSSNPGSYLFQPGRPGPFEGPMLTAYLKREASSNVVLTYNYTPVPELNALPMALGLCALVSTILIRRPRVSDRG